MPPTFSASGINENGVVYTANRRVNWGPFFDNTPRTFNYTLEPPNNFVGVAPLAGTASFDGLDTPVGGIAELRPNLPVSTANRSITNQNGHIVVAVVVTPAAATSAYGLEEALQQLPPGFTVDEIT